MLKQKISPPKQAQMDPNNTIDMEEMPQDAVALVVWRTITGPNPMTIVVTRDSWDENRDHVANLGFFEPTFTYQFESPVNPKGRKTVFQLQGVVSWAAHVYTGIIPVKGIIKGD